MSLCRNLTLTPLQGTTHVLTALISSRFWWLYSTVRLSLLLNFYCSFFEIPPDGLTSNSRSQPTPSTRSTPCSFTLVFSQDDPTHRHQSSLKSSCQERRPRSKLEELRISKSSMSGDSPSGPIHKISTGTTCFGPARSFKIRTALYAQFKKKRPLHCLLCTSDVAPFHPVAMYSPCSLKWSCLVDEIPLRLLRRAEAQTPTTKCSHPPLIPQFLQTCRSSSDGCVLSLAAPTLMSAVSPPSVTDLQPALDARPSNDLFQAQGSNER